LSSNFLSRNAFGQLLIHFRSPMRRLLKPKRFNFGFGQRIKAGQKQRCQFRPLLHGERQRFGGNGYSIHGQILAPICKDFNFDVNDFAAVPPLVSKRLLDQIRERIRYLHYSLKTV